MSSHDKLVRRLPLSFQVCLRQLFLMDNNVRRIVTAISIELFFFLLMAWTPSAILTVFPFIFDYSIKCVDDFVTLYHFSLVYYDDNCLKYILFTKMMGISKSSPIRWHLNTHSFIVLTATRLPLESYWILSQTFTSVLSPDIQVYWTLYTWGVQVPHIWEEMCCVFR